MKLKFEKVNLKFNNENLKHTGMVNMKLTLKYEQMNSNFKTYTFVIVISCGFDFHSEEGVI